MRVTLIVEQYDTVPLLTWTEHISCQSISAEMFISVCYYIMSQEVGNKVFPSNTITFEFARSGKIKK